MMIERHVTFNVNPEKTAEFEQQFIEEYRPAMASMPGYILADLLCESDQSARYQMTIRFDTAKAAAAWRSSPAHQALQPKIKALYSTSELQVYEVIA